MAAQEHRASGKANPAEEVTELYADAYTDEAKAARAAKVAEAKQRPKPKTITAAMAMPAPSKKLTYTDV